MSGPGARRPLAQLIGEVCEVDRPGPHSGAVIKVLGMCEHDHNTFGQDAGDNDPAADCKPLKVCMSCWHFLTGLYESGGRFYNCEECAHPCTLEFAAEWPNGRRAILRYVPDAGNYNKTGDASE